MAPVLRLDVHSFAEKKDDYLKFVEQFGIGTDDDLLPLPAMVTSSPPGLGNTYNRWRRAGGFLAGLKGTQSGPNLPHSHKRCEGGAAGCDGFRKPKVSQRKRVWKESMQDFSSVNPFAPLEEPTHREDKDDDLISSRALGRGYVEATAPETANGR